MDLISSHDSLVSLGLSHSLQPQPRPYSLPPAPHYVLSQDSRWSPDTSHQPILARFPSSLTGSNSRSNFQIYTQLQIPSTSNFGSMKKKKKSSEAAGDIRQSMESDISEERNSQARDYVGFAPEKELEKDLVYVPDFISINNNKPVKV